MCIYVCIYYISRCVYISTNLYIHRDRERKKGRKRERKREREREREGGRKRERKTFITPSGRCVCTPAESASEQNDS
jgi:hypothetical protein